MFLKISEGCLVNILSISTALCSGGSEYYPSEHLDTGTPDLGGLGVSHQIDIINLIKS